MSITFELGPLRISFTLGHPEVAELEEVKETPELTETHAYSTHERAPMGFQGFVERPDFGPDLY